MCLQVISYEVSLKGGNGLPVRWITSLLTLLAVLAHCYRFFTDFVFKVYAFIERNQKNTLLDDLNDPFSLQNLSKMWAVARLARLFAITLKMHPWLLWTFLVETVVLAVHSPPLAFDTFSSVQASGAAALYTNETFVISFMCLRLYILPKMVRAYVANRYSSAKYACCLVASTYLLPPCLDTKLSRSSAAGYVTLHRYWMGLKLSKATTDGKMSVWFAVKVLLHENATIILMITLVMLLVAGGEQPVSLAEVIPVSPRTAYAMRVFELGMREFAMMDSMWVMLLSVSTVGYGDLFPETDYGRFVLVIHQVMGVVVLSTLVAVLQSKLSLSNRHVLPAMALLSLISYLVVLCSHSSSQRKSSGYKCGSRQCNLPKIHLNCTCLP